jgi:hypothetical protein
LALLETISQTALVRWVAESDWGYPITLTAHAIGMSLVVGILLLFDLHVVGRSRGLGALGGHIPLHTTRPFFRVAGVGVVINVVSGSLLFLANYTAFLHNAAFLTKISLLTTAAVGTALLAHDVRDVADKPSRRAQVIAFICVFLWLGAIVAGRIVGYTSVPE